MKIKQKTSARKRRRATQLFLQAITYRAPVPVTKIIVYADDTAYPLCPRCAISLEREYMSFCDCCGQRLNWELFVYARVIRWESKENNLSKMNVTFLP